MNENVCSFINNLNKILIGKEISTKMITAAILAGGNILLEDNPGVGKTIVSKAVAQLISGSNDGAVKFSRIQGTPDLLPYDITGVDIYDPNMKDFTFKQGPVFTDILLFDELNRTTPKVQSALLQCMSEKEVTVGIKTYRLSDIFFVIATQNPIDSEGTYPLPAAQLDRFMTCLTIGYPDSEIEASILKAGKSETRLETLKPQLKTSEIFEIRREIENIHCSDLIDKLLVNIADKTRTHKELKLGLSTRALLMTKDFLKAYSYVNGKNFIDDNMVAEISKSVWAHRIISINPQLDTSELIDKITREEIRRLMRY